MLKDSFISAVFRISLYSHFLISIAKVSII